MSQGINRKKCEEQNSIVEQKGNRVGIAINLAKPEKAPACSPNVEINIAPENEKEKANSEPVPDKLQEAAVEEAVKAIEVSTGCHKLQSKANIYVIIGIKSFLLGTCSLFGCGIG